MTKVYLTGKIGKSVKFDPSTWGATGGDNEAPTLIKKMAKLNPNDLFVVISKNDIEKARKKGIYIPKNIINIFDGANSKEKNDINYVYEKLKDKQIDGCFLLSGPTSFKNIPNFLYKRIKLQKGIKEYAKVINFAKKYVSQIYIALNKLNIPWVLIANDPRYIKQGLDLLNPPVKILSQYNEEYIHKTIDNVEDQNIITIPIKCEYAQMEKIFLLDKDKPKLFDKDIKFMMVLNEGKNGVPSRYPLLKEYVLDHMEDVEIYGEWNESILNEDKRFKGPKKFSELQQILPRVKYTLVIPIKKGWVTSKYIEMIYNGIIPFFHPTYDEQKHCKVPNYLRLQKPEDLYKKIDELENNPELYNKILNECLQCITDDDLSGVKLWNIIKENMPKINKQGKLLNNKNLDEW